MESCGVTFHHIGAVFLRPSEHGRASWASIEPEEDWIVDGVILTCDKDVMELSGLGNGEVARIELKGVEFSHHGEAQHTVTIRIWACVGHSHRPS